MTKFHVEFSLLFFSTGKYDCEIKKKLNTWFYSTINNLVIICANC